MANLQQILSAIIRDVSKARFSSDLYSRSIARYYENDYLLRRFPIPRTEIDELELDLKFSIDGIVNNPVNGEGKEANLAFVLERTSEELVATFLGLATEYSEEEQNQNFAQQLRSVLAKGFRSAAMRIEMRQYVLRYFIESYTHLIDQQGKFSVEQAKKHIGRPLLLAMFQFRVDDQTITLKDFFALTTPMCEQILGKAIFFNKLESLSKPIETIWRQCNDVLLDVQIGHDTLRELPESCISSIKLKASVRNHMWSEVKVSERQTQRMLTSE